MAPDGGDSTLFGCVSGGAPHGGNPIRGQRGEEHI